MGEEKEIKGNEKKSDWCNLYGKKGGVHFQPISGTDRQSPIITIDWTILSARVF